MSSNGLLLHQELPQYPGHFLEMNSLQYPITTLAGRNGFRNEPSIDYTMTRHTNVAVGTSNNKPDNAGVTYGSTGFTTGSQCMQVVFEGFAETYRSRGDQELGRTLGFQGRSNPSLISNVTQKDRGIAEALDRIKGQIEFQALYGVYNKPSAGTTGLYSQRGLRNDADLLVGTAASATPGTGTLGTTGTLTRNVVFDHLINHYNQKLWGSEGLVVQGGAEAITALNYMFMDEFNMGKNGVSHQMSGIDLVSFVTPYGDIHLNLTRDPANTQHLWFLNPLYLDMVARPVPGKGVLFEEDTSEKGKAHESTGIYGEIGMDYMEGKAHSLILGVSNSAEEGIAVI